MSALPLNEVLGDFEDALLHINDASAKKEITLVADSIRSKFLYCCRKLCDINLLYRLGGAILNHYPEMLAAQLNGRLLPERANCPNIRSLLKQCDDEGLSHNGLVPTFHCMHTPGTQSYNF